MKARISVRKLVKELFELDGLVITYVETDDGFDLSAHFEPGYHNTMSLEDYLTLKENE